jgi:hypothetical protein
MDFTDIGDVAITVPPLSGFPNAVDVAYCERLRECCGAGLNNWDPNCAAQLDNLGGVFGQGAFNAAFDSGLVQFDASAAHSCLLLVRSLTCGTIPAAGLATVIQDCFGAMQGTLAIDAGPCINSLECSAGFCKLAQDGGPGFCHALAALGQPCTDPAGSTDCTYLGNGVPPLFCGPNDAGMNVCQNALPLSAPCNSGVQCASGSCYSTGCSSNQILSNAGICSQFITDAGAD